MAMLAIQGITKRFGGLVANDDVTFQVEKGEIFAVIGPNGAGKTTLFNMIAGTFPPSEGKVMFDGAAISGRPVAQIAQAGLVRTYQLVQLFKALTVAENVMVGFHRVTTGGVFSALLRPPAMRRQEREIAAKTAEILDFVGLSHRANVTADLLPYGEQHFDLNLILREWRDEVIERPQVLIELFIIFIIFIILNANMQIISFVSILIF